MLNLLRTRLICSSNKTIVRTQLNICAARFYSDKNAEVPVESIENVADTKTKIGGFAKAYEKQSMSITEKPVEPEDNVTFASLLKNSKFIDLGDPEGKIVNGKIIHIVGDDLYIDFGWKFHCVCVRPSRNSQDYVRGAKVRLRIKSLELSTRFLGASKDLTILEADCHLLGLVTSPTRRMSATANN